MIEITISKAIAVTAVPRARFAREEGTCPYCDDESTCGERGLYLTSRFAAEAMRDFGIADVGAAYAHQFIRLVYRQRAEIQAAGYPRPNLLLVPLCAPKEVAGNRFQGLEVVITSQVKIPTVRLENS